jgi:hypothetical protein
MPRCAPLVLGLNNINLNWMLEERHILLCLLEMDLEVQEAMLVEEQARGLHPFDGRDLLVELEGLRAHVDGVEAERTTEVR